MNLYKLFLDSPSVLRLSLFFSQRVPGRVGRGLARVSSTVLSWTKPAIYQILQANLQQVMGPAAGQQTLDRTARHVFYCFVRAYFDLFRALRRFPEGLSDLVECPEATRALAGALRSSGRGTVLVLPHLGSFDLGGLALIPLLPEMQIITFPDPPALFELTNELRQRSGLNVVPSSPATLRQAIRLLRKGGVVSIAGDRPVSELDEPVSFFGRPARVPSGHVRLALQTDAAIVLAYCILSPETQRYMVYLEPPMELVRTGNKAEELQINMRRLLDALEAIIARWPEQWQMFVPVWPQVQEA
jgi:KDO2-lipid IV(A) lauroyltransferase